MDTLRMTESLPATSSLDVPPAAASSINTGTSTACSDNSLEPESEQDPLGESLARAERSLELHDAVNRNDHGLVERLLRSGVALVNDEDSDGKLPIHVAAQLRLPDMVSLLLKHGTELDALDRAGKTQLYCEAESGNLAAVEFLLDVGATADARSLGRKTALLAAAESGHVKVAQLLVKRGADVMTMDDQGRTPLSAAAKSGRLACVQLLAEHGAALDAPQRLGRTPMLLAASNGHASIVAYLLSRNAALISDRDDNLWTPLHAAAGNGREDVVDFLLDKRAQVDDVGPHGATPLYLAAQRNHQRTVELLIKCGANVDAKQAQGRTPLLAATERGSLSVVRLLINAGASVREQDGDGDSPLLVAVAKGLFDIASVLVGKDAALVNEKNGHGITPLMTAARLGRYKFIDLLVEYGACLDDVQQFGRTALMLAISNRHVVTAQKLIGHGADVNTKDHAGWTPLHIAAASKQAIIMQWLLRKGVRTDDKNIDGSTPLDLAVKQGFFEGVDALLSQADAPDYAVLSAMAARFGRIILMTHLLSRGEVDLCAHVSESGKTILLSLVRWNYLGLFSTLLNPKTAAPTEPASTPTSRVGGGASLLLATLQSLQELCSGAKESQLMYTRVVERLSDVCTSLLAPSAPLTTPVVKTLAAIVFRFARQLLQYRRQPMIARFISAYTNSSNLRDLHEEIDNLMAKADLSSSATVHATWRSALKKDREAQRGWYLQEVGNGDALITELKTQEERESAIAHLALMSSSRGRAEKTDKEAMESAIRRLIGRSDNAIPDPPAWFISRHGIELTKTRSARSNQFVTGRWLRTTVAIAECNLELARFREVAATWKRLGHPNVMDLFGAVDVSQPRIFVCSVHQTLREYLRTARPSEKMFEMLYGAAQGLLFLHQRHIVHGRLTTDCILVGNDGKPKIGGLDRDNIAIDAASRKNAATSTRKRDATAWMAPELTRGEPASIASDVYALGVCIMDILTMDNPWRVRFQIPLRNYLLSDRSPFPCRVGSLSYWSIVKEMCAPNSELRVNIGYVVPKLGYLAVQAKTTALCKRKGATATTSASKTSKGPVDLKYWKVPGTGHTIEKTLKMLHRRCSDFTVSQKMAEHIHARLCDAFKRMVAKRTTPTSLEVDKFIDIVDGFAHYLQTCVSDTSLAMRVVSQKAVFGHHVFHTRIDSLLDLLKVRKDSERDWQYEYNEHVKGLAAAERSYQGTAAQHIVTVQSVYASRYGGPGSSSAVKVHGSSAQSDDCEWLIHLSEIVYSPSDYLTKGAFGEIFRGVWMQGTQVVIKFIADNDNDKEKKSLDPKLFLHEVRIWYQLRHPHVVRLWGAGDTGRQSYADKFTRKRYFVCEFASNGTLAAYVKELHASVDNGELTETVMKRRKWELLRDAALGLQYCHEANVIHNDLNGSNILVGDDEKAKLTDFGLSCMPSKHELKFSDIDRMGAIQWKAPEYITTGEPTFESDIYSFAMCIVEVMKGECPWGLATADEAVKKAHSEDKLPEQPGAMKDHEWGLIKLMTKTDPKQRVGIAFVVTKLQEIIAELDSATSDAATTADG